MLTLNFWFNTNPAPLTPAVSKIFFAVFLTFILISIGLRLAIKIEPLAKNFFFPRIARKIKNLFLTMGIIGLVMFFFSYERVTLLSSRFWYGLWLIGFLTWFIFALRYCLKLPKGKKELEFKRNFEKYLPR